MKVIRFASIGLGLAGVLALAWLVGGGAYARYRERQVEAEWVRSFGTFDEMLKRYPRTATNDTTGGLEQLAKGIGLDLTAKDPNVQSGMAVSSAGTLKDGDAERRHSATQFLMTELRKPEADISPLPSQTRTFLSEHADTLRTIEEELLTSEPPRWTYDTGSTSYLEQQPIPDTSALIALHRVLLTKALAAYADGDSAAAVRSLEASWNLNLELRRVPNSLCQIVARGAASWQLGVIRKISVDAEKWRARISEHDYKQSQLDAELLHMWPSAEKNRAFEDLARPSETSTLNRLRDRLLKPYGILIWAQVTEGTRRDLVEIRGADVVRDFPEGRRSRFNPAHVMLSIQLPSMHGMFRRVDEYLLDVELTDKILQARELRSQNGEKWPATIPGVEATRLPDARWLYTVSPEGVMNIQLSQQPYKDRGGYQLPLCFSSS